ncbi:hypothetical protein TNIN_81391 [Trichonephila inaurata madagascariensis]|uniref:Uncharacterized protein n=1 Tax=Trichonephila inaurata madagascariensis TaxID=2747483 RepID=A0A8X7CA05_9ARAC|nr:hypothetical protein TNIN_81391 [Trichonephila inaurata madagascariensis]
MPFNRFLGVVPYPRHLLGTRKHKEEQKKGRNRQIKAIDRIQQRQNSNSPTTILERNCEKKKTPPPPINLHQWVARQKTSARDHLNTPDQ